MKPETHPEYGYVVFHDVTADTKFLIRSTLKSDTTTTWEDGNEYPLITLDISSASHPFYTGKARNLVAEGRIAKFNRRYKRDNS